MRRPERLKEAILRILFDQGTPLPLRNALKPHFVSTAFEMGWSTLKNGELLKAAETQFDVLITTDQNLRHEQNLTGRKLAIVILPYASWPKLKNQTDAIVYAIKGLSPGDYLELKLT